MKEKELQDANDDLKKTLDVNQNLRQRNGRLRDTRSYNMEKASEDYRTFNREMNSRAQCSREEVINELKDVWRFKLNEEKSVLGPS